MINCCGCSTGSWNLTEIEGISSATGSFLIKGADVVLKVVVGGAVSLLVVVVVVGSVEVVGVGL